MGAMDSSAISAARKTDFIFVLPRQIFSLTSKRPAIGHADAGRFVLKTAAVMDQGCTHDQDTTLGLRSTQVFSSGLK
jgi:hypothetical protein